MGNASAEPRLLADIGGTHARFGWQRAAGAPVEAMRTYRGADHATLQQAVERYLAECGMPRPKLAVLAMANPVTGDQVRMTNRDWSFSIEALRQALALERLVVLNDFEALALALPTLEADEAVQLAGGAPEAGAPKALIGPGTGLGVAGLVPTESGRWRAIGGEGGHVSLSPVTAREAAVVAALQRRFGHASAERAVSGPGLVWLHDALADLDGAPREAGLDAAEITTRDDARSTEALQLFLAFLGNTAGNLTLTLGARGGTYIGGGIVPRIAERVADSLFLERFIGKGRMGSYLTAIPVYLITSERQPALRGAAQAL